jgi:ornithine cyclodeaminase/alanine dehydrogenase-like protein (mu-crystallin family)
LRGQNSILTYIFAGGNMGYAIVTDEELASILTMKDVLPRLEEALRAQSEESLVAPPRFRVGVEDGDLVFTAGAETKYSHVIGFRVYETISNVSRDNQQLVAVFDSDTGGLKGIIIGHALGGLRTGGLGGVAIKSLSRPDSRVLGLLGSGFQARFQLEGAAAARPLQEIRVYSPTQAHRETFVQETATRLGAKVAAVLSAEVAAREADILIRATGQTEPVFDPDWLQAGSHVTTIGPKFKEAHELPLPVAARSGRLVTDSLAQVDAYGQRFFLEGTPHRQRMIGLSDVVAGRQEGRTAADEITLFCSVGLAGTEVVVADEAFRRLAQGR